MKNVAGQRIYWIKAGLNFGYPTCCIERFITMDHLENLRPNPWAGTGFIPCEECAKRPMMEMMGLINSMRNPKLTPFPRNL